MKRHVFAVCFCFIVATAIAGDWPQWRGPERNGLSQDAVKLVEKLDGKSLPQLWKSEKILGDFDGGYSSAAVAGGKVYLYSAWATKHDVQVIALDRDAANPLGLIPDKVDDALMAKLEGPRMAMGEIADREARQKAAREWIAANLSDEEKKALGNYAEGRLLKGKDGLSVDVLRKVATIIDRQFAKQADLDAWYQENGIDEAARKQINAVIPKQTSTYDDMIFCLDAADGKTLWKKSWPSTGGRFGGGSSVPLVVDNRLFFLGGNAEAHCLNAETGEDVWKVSLAVPRKEEVFNSSFLYFDGKVFILAGQLHALNAATGEIAWKQEKITGDHGSPILWRAGDQPYVICGGSCVQPQDGKIVWQAKGGLYSTPVIAGSTMAIAESSKGLVFFQIAPDKAIKAGETKEGSSRGASVATDGKAFFTTGKNDAAAFDATTFAEIWKTPGLKEDFASPIVADGKLIGFSEKGEVGMFNLATGEALGKIDCGALRCTSPVLSGGLLYVRTKDALVCYDLRKKS